MIVATVRIPIVFKVNVHILNITFKHPVALKITENHLSFSVYNSINFGELRVTG
jgi:hypothetical protein